MMAKRMASPIAAAALAVGLSGAASADHRVLMGPMMAAGTAGAPRRWGRAPVRAR